MMGTVPLLDDDELTPRARAVLDDIRTIRGTDFINNFLRTLAHDPDVLEALWFRLKDVMAPWSLDALTKEPRYVAVSTANGFDYCIHSHTASAKSKGMTQEGSRWTPRPVLLQGMTKLLQRAAGYGAE